MGGGERNSYLLKKKKNRVYKDLTQGSLLCEDGKKFLLILEAKSEFKKISHEGLSNSQYKVERNNETII